MMVVVLILGYGSWSDGRGSWSDGPMVMVQFLVMDLFGALILKYINIYHLRDYGTNALRAFTSRMLKC